MGRHDRAARFACPVELELLTGLMQLAVTPCAGFGFAAGDAECAGADQQRQLMRPAPAGQIAGNGCGPWMPAMVSMPELQSPVMSTGQIPQQLPGYVMRGHANTMPQYGNIHAQPQRHGPYGPSPHYGRSMMGGREGF